MKTLVATPESIKAAKKVWGNSTLVSNLHPSAGEAFNQALDALFVPQAEAWKDISNRSDQFEKHNSQQERWVLTYWSGLAKWELHKNGAFFCQNKMFNDSSAAQAWADAEIEKYEAGRSCNTTTVDYEARAKALQGMSIEEVAGFLRTVDEVGNKFQDFVRGKKP